MIKKITIGLTIGLIVVGVLLMMAALLIQVVPLAWQWTIAQPFPMCLLGYGSMLCGLGMVALLVILPFTSGSGFHALPEPYYRDGKE